MENNLPQRKEIRLKEYDYSQEGYYFITICTKNRECILSQIKTNNINKIVGVAAHGDPQIHLTNIGAIVEKYIQNYDKFNNIKIDKYVIMPAHVHIIIGLNGSPRAATPTIPNVINAFKSLITKELGHSIWQRNYYEHIIRNEKEYYKILEYMEYNPIKWLEKNADKI